MFPISKPNTHSANLSLLPLRLWPRIRVLQLQCWLRPELLLHWHSQSRSGLSLFPLNWLYIGNWGKAKPWNCTTRFAHIVHDTIWQWYAGGFSHPSGSQGRLLNMPRHDSVCLCVSAPVCVGENSLMEIEGSRFELLFLAWRQFARQTECRFGFAPAKRKLNSYEVSTFGIQCKSFKLKMRSKHTHTCAHTDTLSSSVWTVALIGNVCSDGEKWKVTVEDSRHRHSEMARGDMHRLGKKWWE